MGIKTRYYRDRNNDLIRRWKDGDRPAGDELIALNTPLILRVVNRYLPFARGRMEAEDLEQEGRIGLLHAAEKYDEGQGNAFATYAFHWIRQTIRRSIETRGSLIAVPIYQQQEEWRLTGEEPAEDEEEPRKPRRFSVRDRISSLDHPVSDDGTVLADFVTDAASVDWEEGVLARIWTRDLLALLDAVDRDTLIRRFGLDGGDRETLAEMSRVTGRSRQGCNYRITRALRHAAEAIEEQEEER